MADIVNWGRSYTRSGRGWTNVRACLRNCQTFEWVAGLIAHQSYLSACERLVSISRVTAKLPLVHITYQLLPRALPIHVVLLSLYLHLLMSTAWRFASLWGEIYECCTEPYEQSLIELRPQPYGVVHFLCKYGHTTCIMIAWYQSRGWSVPNILLAVEIQSKSHWLVHVMLDPTTRGTEWQERELFCETLQSLCTSTDHMSNWRTPHHIRLIMHALVFCAIKYSVGACVIF